MAGWYRVIKTVRGRKYAYLQRSFRDGGHVRTESRYLGPVSGFQEGGAAIPVPVEPEPSLSVLIPLPPNSGPTESPKGDASVRPSLASIAKDRLRLRFVPSVVNLDDSRLQREYARVIGWAQGLGASPESFPSIAIRFGSKPGIRRAWFGNALVATAPMGSGRKAIRTAAANALGHAFLDAIRTANPLAHAVLSERLQGSYRASSWLVFRALALQSQKPLVALSLQIFWFGNVSQVLGFSAQSYGLVETPRRTGWEDEAAAIIGEIAASGYRHTLLSRVQATADAYEREHKARRNLEKCKGVFATITGRRRTLRKRLAGATFARLATEEAGRKLRLLVHYIPELEG